MSPDRPLRPELFGRLDPTDDAAFYVEARKVVHIEAGAIAALRATYAERLPREGAVLDLMSSWRSHLPDGHRTASVVGLGMNAAEMADNPQLDRFVVHDLNVEPRLPFDDSSFAAVVCAVSVQYLVQPIAVFTDVARVLRPGGVFITSFSNRCFPTKAVIAWLQGDDDGHRRLVRSYFTATSAFTAIVDEQIPTPDDPLFVVRAVTPSGADSRS